eukprot:13492081-Alexandrium_andersonii.AAC.1
MERARGRARMAKLTQKTLPSAGHNLFAAGAIRASREEGSPARNRVKLHAPRAQHPHAHSAH